MARAGDRIADPVSGAEIVFRRTAADTGGDLLRFEVAAAPRWSAGPLHVHPNQEERVEVVAGTLGSRLRRDRRTNGAGDVVRVPPTTPHTFWNAGDGELRLVVEFRPALRTEYLFETALGLGRTRDTRTSLAKLVRLLVAARGYREEVRLARPSIRLASALAIGVASAVAGARYAISRSARTAGYTRRPRRSSSRRRAR